VPSQRSPAAAAARHQEPAQTAEKAHRERQACAHARRRLRVSPAGPHDEGLFALSLLDPLLVSDESAKLYQALIKENQIASNVSGGFNYARQQLDYNGPMLYTFRVDYRPDSRALTR
jgi:hypothetical protein